MAETLEQNYARGGFRQSLAAGQRPALLIVDFVRAYLLERSPLFGGAGCLAALEGARSLLEAARSANVPVLHTNVAFQSGGQDGGVFFRKVPALTCFEADHADPELAAFAEGLEPRSGEVVITKRYASAFFATHLAATLTSMGRDTLLIAGVSTSGCIRATAVDCCQHGFIPWVVREAGGDRAPGPHEANLFDLQAKYAEVVPLEVAVSYVTAISAGKDQPAT
ncbi:MAG: isochorismatase family protein [Steroidobacteraceae bacterium]